MKCLVVVSLLLLASNTYMQRIGIDQNVLDDIFGRIGDTSSDQLVFPAELEPAPAGAPLPLGRAAEEGCTCLPYYLCDDQLNDVRSLDPAITGYGIIDTRFGDSKCEESVELCCKTPKNASSGPPEQFVYRGCGYSNPRGLDVTLLTTGPEAQFGEFPWVAALLEPRAGYVGAAALIHPQVVLTSAHVVARFVAGGLRARAGEWDVRTPRERRPHQERLVVEICYPPDFDAASLQNDIAALRLESPMELAAHVGTICLPPPPAAPAPPAPPAPPARGCVSGGWGKDMFGARGKYAAILKKVVQDIVPRARCQAMLRRTELGAHFSLHPSLLCAGGLEGRDTCEGDGGAPLACPLGAGRYQLAGLVAGGRGCGRRAVPALFADVSHFRRWLDDKMAAWGLDPAWYTA